jgi:hypothetical protein
MKFSELHLYEGLTFTFLIQYVAFLHMTLKFCTVTSLKNIYGQFSGQWEVQITF